MRQYMTVENIQAASWLALTVATIVGAYCIWELRRANGHAEFIRMSIVTCAGWLLMTAMLAYLSRDIVRVPPGFAGYCAFGLRVVPVVVLSFKAWRIWTVLNGHGAKGV